MEISVIAIEEHEQNLMPMHETQLMDEYFTGVSGAFCVSDNFPLEYKYSLFQSAWAAQRLLSVLQIICKLYSYNMIVTWLCCH